MSDKELSFQTKNGMVLEQVVIVTPVTFTPISTQFELDNEVQEGSAYGTIEGLYEHFVSVNVHGIRESFSYREVSVTKHEHIPSPIIESVEQATSVFGKTQM